MRVRKLIGKTYIEVIMSTQIFKDQDRFMALGGQVVDKLDIEQFDRYMAHVKEAFIDELVKARENSDWSKVVDGLVDTIVVSAGALISLLGRDGAEAAWDAVHCANMSKVDGSLGPIRWRSDGQVGKPDGFVGPEANIESLCFKAGLVDKVEGESNVI